MPGPIKSTSVWVLFPRNDKSTLSVLRDGIRRYVQERGWEHQELVTEKVLHAGNGKKPFQIVSPTDAIRLYQRIHRARVGPFQRRVVRLTNSCLTLPTCNR